MQSNSFFTNLTVSNFYGFCRRAKQDRAGLEDTTFESNISPSKLASSTAGKER